MGKGFYKESAVAVMSSTIPLQSSSLPSTPPKSTGVVQGNDKHTLPPNYEHRVVTI